MRTYLAACLLLLAACDVTPKVELPPVSYWSVTHFPNELVGCPILNTNIVAPEPNTAPARLFLEASGAVTYQTLSGDRPLTGRLSEDGDFELHLSELTSLKGELDETEFDVRGTYREGRCSMRLHGVRYSGPAICDVTTDGEEEALGREVEAAVQASSLPKVRAFFESMDTKKQFYALVSVTRDGDYQWDADHWALTSTGSTGITLHFSDGSIAELPGFDPLGGTPPLRLVGPGGWVLTGTQEAESYPLTLDGLWTIRFGYMDIMTGPYEPSLLPSGPVIGEVVAYETPVGTIQGNRWEYELTYTLPDFPISVSGTSSSVILRNGPRIKSLDRSFMRAYCPQPERDLVRIFPDLLQEMGLCAVESKDVFPRQCMVEP